jgi:hypothetical protein
VRGREPVRLVCAHRNLAIPSGKQLEKKPQIPSSSHLAEKGRSVWADIECKTVVSSVARRVIGPARKSSKPQARKAERDPPN